MRDLFLQSIIISLDATIKEFKERNEVLNDLIAELEALKLRWQESSDVLAALQVAIERAVTKQALHLEVIEGLEQLKKKYDASPRAARILFFNEEGKEINSMEIQIDKQKKALIKIVDKAGNDAKVDGLAQWELDAEFAVLEVAEDGLSAQLKPTGKLGVASLKVKADADLGEGVEHIEAQAELAFLPGKAVGILLSVSDAEPAVEEQVQG